MNIGQQIQGIKLHLNNITLQLENIEMQNINNAMNMNQIMMNQFGEQFLNLSFQIFNMGIQTFNTGKDLVMNTDIFFDQLIDLSGQINFMIQSHNMEKMNQMLFQHPIINQQEFFQQELRPSIKANFFFKGDLIKTFCLCFEPYTKVKELYEKFSERVQTYYGIKNGEFFLIYNAKKIENNCQQLIKDYFNFNPNFPPPPFTIIFIFK